MKKTPPQAQLENPSFGALQWRRAILTRTLVGFVVAIVEKKVIAKDINPIEPAYVEWQAKVAIGQALIDMPDSKLDYIDAETPTVWRARKLVEMALIVVLKAPSPVIVR